MKHEIVLNKSEKVFHVSSYFSFSLTCITKSRKIDTRAINSFLFVKLVDGIQQNCFFPEERTYFYFHVENKNLYRIKRDVPFVKK